jgi:hypothetical protein
MSSDHKLLPLQTAEANTRNIVRCKYQEKIILKLSEQALWEEATYMEPEAAADAEEDAIPDDGAI